MTSEAEVILALPDLLTAASVKGAATVLVTFTASPPVSVTVLAAVVDTEFVVDRAAEIFIR